MIAADTFRRDFGGFDQEQWVDRQRLEIGRLYPRCRRRSGAIQGGRVERRGGRHDPRHELGDENALDGCGDGLVGVGHHMSRLGLRGRGGDRSEDLGRGHCRRLGSLRTPLRFHEGFRGWGEGFHGLRHRVSLLVRRRSGRLDQRLHQCGVPRMRPSGDVRLRDDPALDPGRGRGEPRGNPVRPFGSHVHDAADRNLVGWRTLSGSPDLLAVNLGTRGSGVVPSCSRLGFGHDPFDQFRGEGPCVDAHAVERTGRVLRTRRGIEGDGQ